MITEDHIEFPGGTLTYVHHGAVIALLILGFVYEHTLIDILFWLALGLLFVRRY